VREAGVLGIETETFAGTYPFAPHYAKINGFAMHYVDAGSGEPILMLHGDPTWSYLYRNFVPALLRNYRCIVPDHMGMGKSEVAPDATRYHLRQHIDNLEALVLDLDLRGITLVLHDWGGPVGLGMAVRQPERIARLVLMNTWAFAPWPGGPLPRMLEIIRSDRGEAFVLKRNGYLEPAIIGTTFHPERLTQTVMDAYRAPFPTPASRIAMLRWSRDIPVQETDASFGEMRRIEENLSRFAATPTLLIWGMRDPVLPPSVLHHWQRVLPHADTVAIDDASHFLQEDAPEEIVAAIGRFIAAHPGER
jgi:pimeloyl-ACP methyl ester carboxylesterase